MFQESTNDIILLRVYTFRYIIIVDIVPIIYAALDPVSRNDRFGKDAFSIRYAKNRRPA